MLLIARVPIFPVAVTLFSISVTFTCTVLTAPVALTPAEITSLMSISKPPATTGAIVPVALTLFNTSVTFTCTVLTAPVAVAWSRLLTITLPYLAVP